MRLMTALVLATLMAAPAIAQQSAPPSDQPPETGTQEATPPAEPPPEQPPAAGPQGAPAQQNATPQQEREPRGANAMRNACLGKARQQGLRGSQLIDAVQLCVAEAHLSCVKKAIAQHINGPARRDYLRTCPG